MTFNWRYIFEIAAQHKARLIRANVVALLAAMVAVPLPLFMPLLVDEVLLEQPGWLTALIDQFFPQNWLGPILYISVILTVTVLMRLLALVLNVWQARQFSLMSKDVTFQIRKALLHRLQKVSMAEYESLGSGKVNTHFVTDIDTLDRFIGSSLSRLLVALLMIIGTAIILLWMHWQLALFILLLNPVVIFFTTVVGKEVKKLKRKENSAYEVFQTALTETLDAIIQIRTFSREQHYLSRLVDYSRSVRDNAARYEWRSDAANRFSFIIFMVGVDLFRALSMLMVVFSDLTIGEMMAVFGYLWFMMGPVQEVLGIQYAFYAAKAALARLNDLYDLTPEKEYPCEVNPFLGKKTVAIELHNIHFGYSEENKVLKGVSLEIQPGQKIALVGASGGGKSTLVHVLLGLYPMENGQICFDQVPIEKVGFNCVRENVATVLQHPVLFDESIRSNLSMGREHEDPELWQALEIAQLKQWVLSLDDQLDTMVGRQGIRLSGGQRQRLAIARMVLSEPKVVVLDEATSALDSETELNLHQALDSFLQGRTTIIVAHRLSAVKRADHVYVFEDGKIAEQGRHQELLQGNGLYARLYGEYQ